MRTRLLAIGLAAGIAACTGSTGPQGPAGTAGQNGMNGSNGQNGNDIILSDKAKLGLDIAPVALDLAGKDGPTIEKIGQGSYLVNAIIDCSGCHTGTAGYLGGGVPFQFAIPGDTGDFVVSRNLTPDATGLMLSEDQFIEALTTGRDFSQTGTNAGNGQLIIMPWYQFRWLHTDDLHAIYAYLKAIPPVANANQADNKGTANNLTPIALPDVYDRGAQTRDITPEKDFMGNPIPDADGVIRGIEVNPLNDPTNLDTMDAETQARFGRGSYLVNAAVCNDCHTNPPYSITNEFKITSADFLKGGAVFPSPPGLDSLLMQERSMSKNLLGTTHGFFNESGQTFLNFKEILATGTHFDDPGAPPLAWPMPWDKFRNMTEEDLVSLYTYLTTIAKNEGAVPSQNDKDVQGTVWWCDANHACPAGAGFTCHTTTSTMAGFGNECVGNSCTTDADCGACQHCTGTVTKTCTAPDPANGADLGCVYGGI